MGRRAPRARTRLGPERGGAVSRRSRTGGFGAWTPEGGSRPLAADVRSKGGDRDVPRHECEPGSYGARVRTTGRSRRCGVTVCEWVAAPVLAAMARRWPRQRRAVLAQGVPAAGGGWILLAGRLFYKWGDWARRRLRLPCWAGQGANSPVRSGWPDGSYRPSWSQPGNPAAAVDALIEAATPAAEGLDPAQARHVGRRVRGDGRDGKTIADSPWSPHQPVAGRTRRPGRGVSREMGDEDRERPCQDRPARPRQALRSGSPGLVEQEI